jgi:thiamine-phosphate pyrophosphorylase
MDAAAETGDEGVMTMSSDADRLWRTAQALNRAAAGVSPAAGRLPPLLFLTDPERTPEPWIAAAALPPGAGIVYRHFGADDRQMVAERLRRVTTASGVRLLIGQDARLAEAVSADGVHLPDRDLGLGALLRVTRPDWILTGAVHDRDAIARAQGLDALILSPVFRAGGSSADKPALGIEGFADQIRAARMPVYALGGIDADNAEALIGTGACGIAGVDGVRRAFG